jgi:predicted DNA-binding transcriptional regulator AlpA
MNHEQSQLLNMQEVADIFRVSTRHLRLVLKRGEFPQPIRLGGCIRWSRKTIDDWIASGCKSERRDESGE